MAVAVSIQVRIALLLEGGVYWWLGRETGNNPPYVIALLALSLLDTEGGLSCGNLLEHPVIS